MACVRQTTNSGSLGRGICYSEVPHAYAIVCREGKAGEAASTAGGLHKHNDSDATADSGCRMWARLCVCVGEGEGAHRGRYEGRLMLGVLVMRGACGLGGLEALEVGHDGGKLRLGDDGAQVGTAEALRLVRELLQADAVAVLHLQPQRRRGQPRCRRRGSVSWGALCAVRAALLCM